MTTAEPDARLATRRSHAHARTASASRSRRTSPPASRTSCAIRCSRSPPPRSCCAIASRRSGHREEHRTRPPRGRATEFAHRRAAGVRTAAARCSSRRTIPTTSGRTSLAEHRGRWKARRCSCITRLRDPRATCAIDRRAARSGVRQCARNAIDAAPEGSDLVDHVVVESRRRLAFAPAQRRARRFPPTSLAHVFEPLSRPSPACRHRARRRASHSQRSRRLDRAGQRRKPTATTLTFTLPRRALV